MDFVVSEVQPLLKSKWDANVKSLDRSTSATQPLEVSRHMSRFDPTV